MVREADMGADQAQKRVGLVEADKNLSRPIVQGGEILSPRRALADSQLVLHTMQAI